MTRPRRHRLLRRPDFTACYDEGRRFFSKHFMLFVKIHASCEADWRVGMAVSKKVGPACVRNRVKRVLREFFRLHQHLMPVATDMVVVPRRQLDACAIALMAVTPELTTLVRQAAMASASRHALQREGIHAPMTCPKCEHGDVHVVGQFDVASVCLTT